jgi:hypothetical protein
MFGLAAGKDVDWQGTRQSGPGHQGPGHALRWDARDHRLGRAGPQRRGRLLGETYLPLGTTAHKQGRVAGENACGGYREFAGSGSPATGRLLGVQLYGQKNAEIAKRVDNLDLSYTPPLGSPWDAVQIGTQAWVRHAGQP